MRMRVIASIMAACSLAGCQMEPKEPTGIFEMTGNYKTISDCGYLEVRKDGANMWRKDDLESQNTTMLTFGMSETTVGRLDFIGISQNRTRVEVRFPNDAYTARYRKVLAVCAQ